MEQADKVIRGGYAAIADAVFAASADRDAAEHVAVAAGVPFAGLWLEAPEPVMISRVAGRGPDASDAGSEVIRRQLAYGLDSLRWHRLDASGTRQQVCDDAGAILRSAQIPSALGEIPHRSHASTALDDGTRIAIVSGMKGVAR